MNTYKDDEIFKSHITDLSDKCFNKNIQTSTGFLDLREQSIVKLMSRDFKVPYVLFGGFEDAQRKKLYFLPDYIDEPDTDISILEISHNTSNSLSHRDYLGSVLGLGVKREKIGDIIVFDKGAQIIIENNISNFMMSNFVKTGRINVSTELKNISQLKETVQEIKIINDTVKSLRLDAIISSGFSCSRGNALKYIQSSKVFVNDVLTEKADKQINEGDKIILRGSGKIILSSIGSLSKKGRIIIEIQKFI